MLKLRLSALKTSWLIFSVLLIAGASLPARAARIFFYNPQGVAELDWINDSGKLEVVKRYDSFPPKYSFIFSAGKFVLFGKYNSPLVVGSFAQDGTFQQTDSVNNFPADTFTRVVNVGKYIFFYQYGGDGLIGFVDDNGKFHQTQQVHGLTSAATAISSDGKNIIFSNMLGNASVGSIDDQGHFHQTQVIESFPPGYNLAANAEKYFFLAATDMYEARVVVVDQQGQLQTTSKPSFTQQWEIVTSHENNLMLYNRSGQGMVGYINDYGNFIPTQTITNFTSNWDFIEAAGIFLFFYRKDGKGAIGYISQNHQFVQTDSLPNIFLGNPVVIP